MDLPSGWRPRGISPPSKPNCVSTNSTSRVTNPLQTLPAEGMGYRIFAKFGCDDKFRGIVVARRDSGVKTVKDLRGKAVSFPSPTAWATIMTKILLKKEGLNVETEAQPKYVGSLDSAIMNVYSGLAAAGASILLRWEGMKAQRPEVTSALEMKWMAPPVGNLAFMAGNNIPEDHVKAIARVLLDLREERGGCKPYFPPPIALKSGPPTPRLLTQSVMR